MEPQDDLDREKVRIFWDYNKTRIYTSLTMMISVFVAIVVILNAINLNGKVPFQLVWAIGFTLTILFLPYILITGVLVPKHTCHGQVRASRPFSCIVMPGFSILLLLHAGLTDRAVTHGIS